MEVKLDPKAIEAVNGGQLRKDWRAIAKRIEAQEGRWQLVENVPLCDKAAMREKRADIFQALKSVGCVTQVVALQGMNINQRPWSGWAVFARIPRSVRTPGGKLI